MRKNNRKSALVEKLSKIEALLIERPSNDQAKPEASGKKPLDNYAFAEDRDDVPEEKNNKFEQELFDTLKDYILDNVPISQEVGEAMKELLASGQYQKIFHRPSKETMYRGMAVDQEFLKKLTNSKNVSSNDEIKGRFVFEPREGMYVSSWTDDIRVAEEFSMPMNRRKYPYSLIMVAHVNDNKDSFVSCPDGLYRLKTLSQRSSESEYLGLGSIMVSGVKWY